jgi:hypothetical protein
VRLQFQILLFIACLNIAVGMVMALGLPGSAYFGSTNSTGSSGDYEERFNASKTAEQWSATSYGIPVIGDIFGGLYFFFNNVRFLIDGFPTLLTWIKDCYIVDVAGRIAFDVVANGLRAVFAIMMAVFMIELITGRYMND